MNVGEIWHIKQNKNFFSWIFNICSHLDIAECKRSPSDAKNSVQCPTNVQDVQQKWQSEFLLIIIKI